jgi:hypothetical protein
MSVDEMQERDAIRESPDKVFGRGGSSRCAKRGTYPTCYMRFAVGTVRSHVDVDS